MPYVCHSTSICSHQPVPARLHVHRTDTFPLLQGPLAEGNASLRVDRTHAFLLSGLPFPFLLVVYSILSCSDRSCFCFSLLVHSLHLIITFPQQVLPGTQISRPRLNPQGIAECATINPLGHEHAIWIRNLFFSCAIIWKQIVAVMMLQ